MGQLSSIGLCLFRHFEGRDVSKFIPNWDTFPLISLELSLFEPTSGLTREYARVLRVPIKIKDKKNYLS